jgi:hypothetical protein
MYSIRSVSFRGAGPGERSYSLRSALNCSAGAGDFSWQTAPAARNDDVKIDAQKLAVVNRTIGLAICPESGLIIAGVGSDARDLPK